MVLGRSLVLVALAASAAGAQPGLQAEPPPRTPFDGGSFGLSAAVGSTYAFGQRYFAIGAGANYYVLDGVGVGLASIVQWGDGPTITRVKPELRYVAQPLVGRWPLIPYAAVFYSRWFVGGALDDVDAVGSRGGFLYVSGRVILGFGVAYERVVSDCLEDCYAIYPDLTLSFAL